MKKIILAISMAASISLFVGCEVSSTELDSTSTAATGETAASTTDNSTSTATTTPAASTSDSSASSSSSSSTASTGGGTGGFLWKPVSESDGNLVVLLPGSLRGNVSGCAIFRGSSRVESGRFAGDTHNGRRPHYRFSMPGAGYGRGLTVRATLRSGGSRSFSVPNGASRVEL